MTALPTAVPLHAAPATTTADPAGLVDHPRVRQAREDTLRVGVIGLGYVGLPLAVDFGKLYIPSSAPSSRSGKL